VRALADAGAEVVLHYGRSRDRAEALADEVGRERCTLVRADLDDETAMPGLWRDALAWKGRIDVLVNNAGIYVPGAIDDDFETWAEVWSRVLRVNLASAAHLCREAVRHYRGRDGGIIVNIASRAAFRGDAPDYSAYAASKGGMIALTRTIARAWGGDGVLAYAIAPGFVGTEMAEEFFAAHGKEPVVREIPLGDVAPPEDIANVVTFLASGAAPHATGTTIDINGASYVR
jgi:NAD(P)-dependent dehydrogenase (short-subunit alcohol dehydrogenase family)